MSKTPIGFAPLIAIAASLLCWRVIALAQANRPTAAQSTGAAKSAVQPLQPPATSGGILPTPGLSDRAIYVHDEGHRCIDFVAQAEWAVGQPVYIYSCNGSIAQQVRVKEIDDSHDVNLMVTTLFCIGVQGGYVALDQPLELQQCNGSPAQRFALDGDSILMGAQRIGHVLRGYAILPQLARTSLRTPLVVGVRQASEPEYFRFEAVDRSAAWPTAGFVRVSTEAWLDWALTLGWGTVIEIDDAQPLELKGSLPKMVHSGVTLRGYRKYTYQGPEIHTCKTPGAVRVPAFWLLEDDVRVTGMRLRGPVNDPRCAPVTLIESQAIMVDSTGRTTTPRALIDHLDIGYFSGSGVEVAGPDGSELQTCPPSPLPYPRDIQAQIVGNFIHHNEAFGSVTGNGAFILNLGNVFYSQGGQSIASDAWGDSGFNAYGNLVLGVNRSPGLKNQTDDVDMHGSENGNATVNEWQGGISGDYFDVGWNTFLHTGHENILQRGTPCRFTAIHDSTFLQSQSASIVTMSTNPALQTVYADTFSAPNPMDSLAAGDFDGDGIDDVFVGTGAAWYFSSGGQAEWRLLNRMPEHAGALRFGDFDGDGRTDIVAIHGSNIDVSWGGVSPWQTINTANGPLSAMAVGDFDGDHVADLFLANGAQWFYAPGGRNWAPLLSDATPTSALAFGDFKHEGRTRVLRVSNGQWQVAGLGLPWQNVGAAPLTAVGYGVVVADFNGDGFADVGLTRGSTWQFTTPARSPNWVMLRSADVPIVTQAIGRFDSGPTSDVIVWNGLDLFIAPSGKDPLSQVSRQDMR